MCNLFSVYIGHHKPFITPYMSYSVLLPCSAFSEYNGLYMNILGMVQRTMKAVQSPVNDTEMLHTTDVVLCSLIRYILQTVKLPKSNMSVLECSESVVHMFKQYFPYALNYVHDMSVCLQLLRRCNLKLDSIIYISVVRSNYSTDIITRNNESFIYDTEDGSNV